MWSRCFRSWCSIIESKKIRFESQGTLLKFGFVSTAKPLLVASYRVAYNCQIQEAPYNCYRGNKAMCITNDKNYSGKRSFKKAWIGAAIKNVIQSQISDLSLDILDQIIADMKASSLKVFCQLDKTTDIENCSQLISLVRYKYDGTIIMENYLFFEDLKRTTKAKDIFQCVKNFFCKTWPRHPSYWFYVYWWCPCYVGK